MTMRLPFDPPLAPMLSAAAAALPKGDGWLFEPKWDGFRTLVFRDGGGVLLPSRGEEGGSCPQSGEGRRRNRSSPERVEPLLAALPERCVLDGEVVIAGPSGL